MGRENNYQNKIAYLAFDDLKIFYSAKAPIVGNNNNDNSSTTTIIIVLSCLLGVLVIILVGFLILRYRNARLISFNYNGFNKKKGALDTKFKEFSIDF